MTESPPEIYALIGNPVGHSLSPLMHNLAYEKMDINARYVAFCVENLRDAFYGIRALKIMGVSVTVPFKVEVMQYLDEVEEEAFQIGAVNTIMNEQGRLKGTNTDWLGIVLALQGSMDIRGRNFAVLGAGGTARAALFGIIKEGGLPVVVNRTEEKGRSLAREWDCPFCLLSDIGRIRADCLINTTPVGMYPGIGASPLPPEVLGNFRRVMDVIYNPLQTKLMEDAGKAGCAVLSGLEMFVHQGAEQIRLWTGLEPPRALMREAVINRLASGKGEIKAH
jgi:shikimate dehydrogenase